MLTDESVLEWAKGWLLPNPPDDPTFRQRFLDGLADDANSAAYGEGATAVWSMLGCGADPKFPNEAVAIQDAKYPDAQYEIRPRGK